MADEPAPWQSLLDDPATKTLVEQYVSHRARGLAEKLKTAEDKLGATDGSLVELSARSVRLEATEAQVSASVEALLGTLPESARGLLPSQLSPVDQLQWLTANLQTLAAPAERTRNVDGTGGRRAPAASKANPGRRWILGR